LSRNAVSISVADADFDDLDDDLDDHLVTTGVEPAGIAAGIIAGIATDGFLVFCTCCFFAVMAAALLTHLSTALSVLVDTSLHAMSRMSF
jgi:hypothetical protein